MKVSYILHRPNEDMYSFLTTAMYDTKYHGMHSSDPSYLFFPILSCHKLIFHKFYFFIVMPLNNE